MNVFRYEGLHEEYPLAVPLLDLIFILLILFVILGTVQTASGELQLTDPDTLVNDASNYVHLDSSGKIYYEGQWYTVEEFVRATEKRNQISFRKTLGLVVDEKTRFSTLKHVLSELRESGLQPDVNVVLSQ